MSQLLELIMDTEEYHAINTFYGEREAKRSKVPLINHIKEGIVIIEKIAPKIAELTGRPLYEASAARAFCLHPMFQEDKDLKNVGYKFAAFNTDADAFVIMLVMEYRWRANNYLSQHLKTGKPDIGGENHLPEIGAMLIADKVQNYKDFILYHRDTHPKSSILENYFETWLEYLGINQKMFIDLSGLKGDVFNVK